MNNQSYRGETSINGSDNDLVGAVFEDDAIKQSQPSKKRRKSNTKKDQPINENRRMAQASRTLKACELCRKQKTRCFRSPDNLKSCLRCSFLKNACSFEISDTRDSTPSNDTDTGKDKKLDLIYSGITEILNIIKKDHVGDSIDDTFNKLTDNNLVANDDNATNSTTVLNDGIFQTPSESFVISPFALINKATNLIPKSISNIITVNVEQEKDDLDDIISNGILTMDQVIELMNKFNRNYGRWVSFPTSLSTKTLIDRIRSKSSLLLTACCCLSARYVLNSDIGDNFERAKQTIKSLQIQLNRDLDKSIKFSTTTLVGQIEYLQALVILSIYSYSLTTVFQSVNENTAFTLDPWLLSSMGLTTFISKSTFGNLFKKNGGTSSPLSILYDELDSPEYQSLTNLRIYNHLCLVHLVNCIFSGRMCIIDEIRINYCSSTLSLPSSTNFDGRMVSEIGILLITYNYVQLNLNDELEINSPAIEKAFTTVLEEVSSWYQQWEFIFNQPTIQFVELCYDFCKLLIYFTYNYQKIQQSNQYLNLFDESKISIVLMEADDNSLSKMVQHAYLVVKTVKHIESDSYFAYLSDQVHYMFFFSGIMLTKLLKFIKSSSKLSILDNINNNDKSMKDKIMKTDLQLLINKLITVSQGFNQDLLFNYSEILTKVMNQKDEKT